MKDNEKKFCLPKNIKQMGNLDENLKIYMEDYVFTYLQQYANEIKGEERIAFLVGESCIIDGVSVLFINGAIKGEETYQDDGIVKFSEKSFECADKNVEKYFPKSKIVGWFYSQPGFSDYINDDYIKYHKEIFKEADNVFFLSDPIENIGGFYRLFDEKLETIKGFIIYYEKNEQMSEYMLDNKKAVSKIDEKRYKKKDERLVELTRHAKYKNGKVVQEHKKISSVFGSLSAVLFLVCFIMGTGLVQSEDRITELERRITSLDSSYRYVLSKMKNEDVQSVFAQGNSKESKEKEASKIKKEEPTKSTTEQATEQAIEQDTEQTTAHKKTIITQKNIKTYKIKEGDSLEVISRRFYGDREMIKDIMEVNEIEDADKIYSGMVIKLP